jgi:hypothetical protein
MNERIMRRVSRCTYCNSKDVTVDHHHELGIMVCLCMVCGNKWGQ